MEMDSVDCAAHSLNLCVKSSIKSAGAEIADTLSKCRSIVGHFKHSNAAVYELREIQEMCELPQNSLLQVCPYLYLYYISIL